VGVAFAKDGSLFVTDYGSRSVWHVTYMAQNEPGEKGVGEIPRSDLDYAPSLRWREDASLFDCRSSLGLVTLIKNETPVNLSQLS
jgi:hypothetical protein